MLNELSSVRQLRRKDSGALVESRWESCWLGWKLQRMVLIQDLFWQKPGIISS